MNESLIQDVDKRAKDILRFHGWYEGRKVVVTEWIETLRSEKTEPHSLEPFPLAVTFLEEFGGLAIKHPFSNGDQEAPPQIVFDPVRVAGGDEDIVQLYGELIGRRTYPVGGISGYMLLLTEDGEMYFDAAGDGKLVGRTINEAFEVMLLRDKEMVMVFPQLMPM